ncbi:SRPBCC family protein [Streptomyces sp. B8F3]|uniref:SRPBCC family protein n=1 Tax=unclassified Streptomyces TaxID=2593676 RepID=UPI00325C8EA8
MASMIREFAVRADEEAAWAALVDVGAVNKLTFLGPVTLDGDVRTADMGEYGTTEELIVSVDDEHRRMSYSVRNSPWKFLHHPSVMEILPPEEGAVGSRARWLVDLKPDSLTEEIATGMDGAVESMKQSLAAVM